MYLTVKDIRKHFIDELKNKNFTLDKTGQKTIEIIGASFIADEAAIFGQVNKEYIDSEMKLMMHREFKNKSSWTR